MKDQYIWIAGIALGIFGCFRMKWLTKSGALGAFMLASATILIISVNILVIPVVFLVIGSLLSRMNKGKFDQYDDSSGRDIWQVVSNSGGAILCLLGLLMTGNMAYLYGYALNFSIAMSDTMSSEVGRYYGGATYDLMSFKKVPVGQSGGVSLQGSIAGLIGAAIIPVLLYLFYNGIDDSLMYGMIAWSFVGMLLDSWLGASIQAKYVTSTGIKEEGERTNLIAGIHGVNNNLVNLISIVITVSIYLLIFEP